MSVPVGRGDCEHAAECAGAIGAYRDAATALGAVYARQGLLMRAILLAVVLTACHRPFPLSLTPEEQIAQRQVERERDEYLMRHSGPPVHLNPDLDAAAASRKSAEQQAITGRG